MENGGLAGIPEHIGNTLLDTIGFVIPSPDDFLREDMALPGDVRSLGVISSRTGAAGQITACDDACKQTGMIPLVIDLPRDTKGWGGHGCYIVLGGGDPENAREAVSMALSLIRRNAGEVYISDAGHLEFAYSANAGPALVKAFGAVPGQAFGFMAASPASIGLVLADRALKLSPITPVACMTPSRGTSHSNEVILAFSGEASAVRQAVVHARELGLTLLRSMGSEAVAPNPERYI